MTISCVLYLLVARITHRRVIRGLKFSKFCIFLAFVPFLTKIAKIVKKYSFIHILEQMTMTIILFIHPLIYLTISKYSFIHCFKIFLVLSHPGGYWLGFGLKSHLWPGRQAWEKPTKAIQHWLFIDCFSSLLADSLDWQIDTCVILPFIG